MDTYITHGVTKNPREHVAMVTLNVPEPAIRANKSVLGKWKDAGMPRETKRVTFLAVKLNQSRDDAGVKQAENVIRAISALDQIAEKVKFAEGAVYRGAGSEKAVRLRKSVMRFFRGAKLTAQLGEPGPTGWQTAWSLPGLPLKRGKNWAFFRSGLALDVLNTATDGTLRRLRECRNCGFWYVARKDDQESCSTRCTEQYYRKTPKGKAGRAAYMRRYRKKHPNAR